MSTLLRALTMASLAASCFTTLACRTGAANDGSEAKDLADTQQMTRREDGNFDVRCRDGRMEIRTQEDILANRACDPVGGDPNEQPRLRTGVYLASENSDTGMNYCRMRVTPQYDGQNVLRQLQIVRMPAPRTNGCNEQFNLTCTGTAPNIVCSGPFNGKTMRLDMMTETTFERTLVEDNVKGTFVLMDPGGGAPETPTLQSARYYIHHGSHDTRVGECTHTIEVAYNTRGRISQVIVRYGDYEFDLDVVNNACRGTIGFACDERRYEFNKCEAKDGATVRKIEITSPTNYSYTASNGTVLPYSRW